MQNTGGKTKSKIKTVFITVIASVLFIFTLFITFGKSFGAPSWSDVYSLFGVSENLNADFSASFLSVGNADACFIQCGDKNLVIDTGLRADYDKLSSFSHRHNVTHFDAMILSHADSDHIGGASDLLNEFSVDTIYMPQIPSEQLPNSVEYSNLVNSVKENNLDITYSEFGDNIAIGDLSIEFIMPDKVYDNINDNSLVFKLTYQDNSFLFTGDISSKVEEDMLNSGEKLKSDVLKAAHHGSKTSSSEEFLSAVSPKITVVSSGKSSGSLPDYTTMARLNKFSSELYSTADDKTVVITSDGNNLKVYTGY